MRTGSLREKQITIIGMGNIGRILVTWLLSAGGPGSIYAAHALDAIDQFLPTDNS